jgi:hypothetical protein
VPDDRYLPAGHWAAVIDTKDATMMAPYNIVLLNHAIRLLYPNTAAADAVASPHRHIKHRHMVACQHSLLVVVAGIYTKQARRERYAE